MKKIILTTIVAIFATNFIQAQNVVAPTPTVIQENRTDFRDRMLFGFKIGTNYSNVYDAKGDAFNAKAKFGLALGAFVAIPLGKQIGIQPEILFSQKGFKATGNILSSPYSITRTSNYIDIPVLFSFKPTDFITINAGPQYSYLLKQTDVFANATTTIAQEQEFGNENLRKNVLCFTGGIDFTMKHLLVSTRVGWDIQNNNGDGTSTTPRYKNVLFQATVGYRFYND
ncbi:MAG: hypothetical protein RL708_161 [Bacteroidota bacterium]|jgi:hypothetical protein